MIENKYRTTSVRAVIRKDNCVLVEWFSPKSISFLPGGTLEPNEELRNALLRELREELLGAGVLIGRYLGQIGHIWTTLKGQNNCLNHFFEVELTDDCGIEARELGREIRWLDLNSPESDKLKPPSLLALLRQTQPDNKEWDIVDSEVIAQ